MWWGMHYGGEGWLWMGFVMAIVWLPLIAGGFWLAQLLASNSGAGGGSQDRLDAPDARELARRAYARGEMDHDRFLQVMQDLDADSSRRTNV